MENAENTKETKKRRVVIVFKNHKNEAYKDVKDAYEGNRFYNIYLMNGDKIAVNLDTIETVKSLTNLDE